MTPFRFKKSGWPIRCKEESCRIKKLELGLASDIHQSEHMEQDTLAQKTKKDKERFEKIVTTQNKIQKNQSGSESTDSINE